MAGEHVLFSEREPAGTCCSIALFAKLADHSYSYPGTPIAVSFLVSSVFAYYTVCGEAK